MLLALHEPLRSTGRLSVSVRPNVSPACIEMTSSYESTLETGCWSRLSRYGEAPLILIAKEAKQELLKQDWAELPLNAPRSPQDPH